jgi:hypothetical protein
LAVASSCWAQLPVDIHRIAGRASDRLKEAERRVRIARGASLRAPKEPEEVAVIDAAAKTYAGYFLPEIIGAPRITTLTENGNDVLIARWSNASSEVIIWDTPEDISFILKLPPHRWSNDSSIRSTFDTVWRPPSAESTVLAVSLNVAMDPLTHRWIGTGGIQTKSGPRQFALGHWANWIDFWETATASYLSLGIDRQFLQLIPERFPPLESRVGMWSKQRLLQELARQTGARRDSVLARELMKRDVSNDELLVLLESRRRRETGAVLKAVAESGEMTRFKVAVGEYLLKDSSGYLTKSMAASGWRPVNDSDVNFTNVALEMLRENAFAGGAFTYVATHGTNTILKAAQHHEEAAKHHRAAAEHHGSGDHHKAGHHAHVAQGHHVHAVHHAEEASKHHASEHAN